MNIATPSKSAGRRKTKAQLIAELETLRQELETYKSIPLNDFQGAASALLGGILEVADDAIITMDESSRIRGFNEGAERIFGFTSGEMIGQPLDVLLPKELQGIHRQHVEKFARRKVSSRLMGQRPEVFGVRKNGERFPAEASISKISVESSKFFTVILRDITDRKSSEKALRASERLMETVFDTMPTPLVIKDTEERYLRVNKEWSDLFGVAPEDVIGRTTRQALHWPAEQQQANVQDDKGVLYEGLSTSTSEQCRNDKDGTVRVFHSRKGALRDDDGNLLGLIAIGLDITDRKRSEEALRESEERFRTVIEQAGDAIFLIDPSTAKFVEVNNQACTALGFTRDELLTLSVPAIDPVFPKEKFDSLIETFTPNDPVTIESVHQRKDGTTIPVEIRSGLIEIDGKLMVLSFARDISERKMLEEQLRESQKMEAVGQLAGGIAHEFNNAMQVILNGAHFIRNNPAHTDSVVELVNMIVKSAERTASLTRQLLGFSRKSPIQLKSLNLNELTSNLMKMLERILGEQIQIELRRGDDLHPVEADAALLEQIVVNLCVNARDAMPDGGRLIIETQNVLAGRKFRNTHGLKQPGPYVMLSVGDTGMGMSPEVHKHIFEPFFTTKEVGKGTGLGLAMVYGAVQQHNGIIEALSEPGAGSTFKIYLPAAETKELKIPEPLALDSPAGSETILVAEDEDDVRTMLSRLLECQGYRVFTARNGKEALGVFKAKRNLIDLVILDMIMPKLAGRDVFERIRETGSDVPVLFCSGYSPGEDESAFLSDNGLRLIQKPYSPNELFTSVREVLDH